MKITESSSFWIVVFSLIIGLVAGSFTHWIVGVILFFLFTGKTILIGVVIDTISSSLSYHHDREDARAQKIIASKMLMKAMKNGVKPGIVRLTKLK